MFDISDPSTWDQKTIKFGTEQFNYDCNKINETDDAEEYEDEDR